MTNKKRKIGVVAPGSRMSSQVAARVQALVATLYPDRTPEIHFHPQCLASHGHFAGDDATRARAFLEIANDESYDAVWCARGGYGSCRVAEAVMRGLTQPARRKAYLGYSDAGTLLAGLYRAGFEAVAHGPVAEDILRDRGESAAARALAWLVDAAPETLEPTVGRAQKTAAFNMTIHVQIRRVAGIMLGRCNKIPPNEPDFGMTEEEVARYWCRRSGIPWLGRADIGHDIDNKIVPFGGRVRPGA